MLKYLLKYKDSTGEANEIFYPTREAVEKGNHCADGRSSVEPVQWV